MLFWLAGCSSPPPDPPDSYGRVLHAGSETLVVQHDDLRGRVVTGVERYRWTPSEVQAGDTVQLWLDGERVERVQATEHGEATARHPLKGTVVNVDGIRVMVDHEAIPGVMNAMVMGFGVSPWEAADLKPGTTIEAALLGSDYGWQLVDIEKTGSVPLDTRDDVAPLAPGETLPRTDLVAEDGSAIVLGRGQDAPTALTYIYTRCPDPTFCPAIGARMAALQEHLEHGRIVTVTIDPEHDTPERLKAWGTAMGADFTKWRLARAEPLKLQDLALYGGQHVTADAGRISHLHRLLILDAQGRLIERYDDDRWPLDRVVAQLEGRPVPPRSEGEDHEQR